MNRSPDAPLSFPQGVPALMAGPQLALQSTLAFSSRDWAASPDLAWVYGIVLGWGPDDDDPPGWGDPEDPDGTAVMTGVAQQFGWDAATVARLEELHRAFLQLAPGPPAEPGS